MSYQEELLMYEPTGAPWTQSRRLHRAPSLGRAALVGMRFRSLCYAAAVECYTVRRILHRVCVRPRCTYVY